MTARIVAALALAVVAGSASGCTIDKRSAAFACTIDDDCSSDRRCDDGFCVIGVRGFIDAGPDDPIDGPQADPDAPPPDAFVCPGGCTSCLQDNTCVIDCSAAGACATPIVCPANLPCLVLCMGDNSCNTTIDCTAADSCDVDCDGLAACTGEVTCAPNGACDVHCGLDNACAGGIDCTGVTSCTVGCVGTGSCSGVTDCAANRPCDVTCSGNNSCAGDVLCSDACSCDITCTGAGACPDDFDCPDPESQCDPGAGCTSGPSPCDDCP